MSLKRMKKYIVPEAQNISDDDKVVSPYIDDIYIGDRKFLKDQIMERFTGYKKPRMLWDAWVFESIAMYVGQHNMWWNPGLGRLEPVPVEDVSRTQAINNRILNKCRAVIQRLISFDPTSQSIPAGPSQLDIYAARMAKRLIQSNHADPKLKYKQQYEKFAEFVVIEGMGWLRTEYDPHGGRCTVTYKETPVYQDIIVEAQQEEVSAFDELGEYLNNPMKELEENGKIDTQESKETGTTGGENSSDGRNQSSQEGAETGQDNGASVDGSATPEQGEAGEDQGAPTDEPEGMGQENQPPSGYTTKRVPKLDDNGKPVTEPVKDEEGRPQFEKIYFDGVVEKRAVGPMNMYYNPTITQWEDAFDCIELAYLSIDEIRTGYPGCEDIDEKDYEQNSINPWLMLFGTSIDMNPYGNQMGIPVYLYNCKSCEEFPMGLKVVIIKDKIRVAIPMPTLNGSELPYDFAGYIPIPGSFRYMSLPLYLKNPQLIQNKLLSQYIDHGRQFAVPKVVMSKNCRLDNELTNGVEIIRYSEGSAKPEFVNPQANSSVHTELIKYMDDTIDTNSGVNKTAEGNPPPNVTSGDMAEAVTENDYQIHMLDIDRVAAAIVGSCNKEIRYIQDQGPDDVLVRYCGAGGKWTVDKFKKAVLRNVGDILFLPGRMANMSRGQQRKDIEMMLPIVTQGQGTPDLQASIIKKALEHLFWGEEEAMITEITKQQNYCLDCLAELDQSANNPKYDPTVNILPFVDLKIFKELIEEQLLNRTEFNQKPKITKDRLIKLWEDVTNRLKQQVQGSMPPQPLPGQGAPPGPGGPPGGPAQAPPSGPPGNMNSASAKVAGLEDVNQARTPVQLGAT